MAALGLCKRAFSSCGEQGMIAGCGAWASHCGGFCCCRAWAVGSGCQCLWCTSLVASQLPDHGWNLCHLQRAAREAPGGVLLNADPWAHWGSAFSPAPLWSLIPAKVGSTDRATLPFPGQKWGSREGRSLLKVTAFPCEDGVCTNPSMKHSSFMQNSDSV